ncbi:MULTISPECIES: lasso peptide biosynthesis PqqD family chaperone [unclassified Embleya]|uniref:lasso peptide biosynthesis PqqD family chaperone n=1 Tax=unclassified Embleya TaxID=2699296 RepID=UPI0033CAD0AF
MTITLAPHVTSTEVSDGLVLLDQRKGRYWQLNRTGAYTLCLLLEGHSAAGVAARLAEKSPAAAAQADTDVRDLLRALCEARLVVSS